jgi:hypothetical protein
MSNQPPRGPFPARHHLRRAPKLQRFDAGPAANDDTPRLPPTRRGPGKLTGLLLALAMPFAGQSQAAQSPSSFASDHRPQPLTAPRAGDAATIATEYLAANLSQLELGSADLGTLLLQDRYRTPGLGTNLFYQQKVDGIPVFNAITSVHVLDNGAILGVNNGAIPEVASKLNLRQPVLSAADAVRSGLAAVGLAPTAASLATLSLLDNVRQGVAFKGTGVTRRPIPARLVYSPRSDGSVRLAWEMYLMKKADEVWYLHVDAADGAVLEKHNLVNSLNKYRVYGFNAESPISTETPVDLHHDLVTELNDRVASPQGWHSGVTTTGNNVVAVEDRNNDDLGGYQPNGTGLPGNLSFDFAHDDLRAPCAQPNALGVIVSDAVNLKPCEAYSPLNPNTNLPAAVVNLFYWNNMMHDVMYHYGFNEGSGNFQNTNFTAEGTLRDADAVFAQAQDGSGTNNANFFTPPDDGITPLLLPPAMQMYEWSPPGVVRVNTPTTFADFDDGDRVLAAATASFGASLADLSEAQRTGDVELGNDGSTGDGTGTVNDGCEPLVGFTPGKIALVERGLCEFGVKVLNAQNAGAKGAILHNTLGREVGNAMGPGAVGAQVTIPSVMIGQSNGLRIRQALGAGAVNLTLQILPVPSRDSDIDAGVIAHEYGHGISNRLIGGPSSIACLLNAQIPDTNSPGALIPIGEQMGEGWSDLFAMILTAQRTDTGNTPRGVGAYISFQNEHGPGIRRYPYTRNMAVNPFTYGNVPGEAVPHGVGSVWATMVWDMYWNLVDAHGFEPNLFNHASTAGNVQTLKLINNGLILTKCRPSFVDGRNAILLAEAADGNLADSCPIWRAFARRGLGVAAINPTLGEDHRQAVEDFTVPGYCATANLAPEAGNDAYATRKNSTLRIGAPGVLANDADPDGKPVSARVTAPPRNARRFALNADGSFEYEPKPGFTGTDSFTYVAQDGDV